MRCYEQRILGLQTNKATIMKYRIFLCLTFSLFILNCSSEKANESKNYTTTFENSNGTETPTYKEVLDYYFVLAKDFSTVNIQTFGETDSGYPLHVVTFNSEGNFNFKKQPDAKLKLLINNGIHPGESDGIDATMLLFRDLAQGKIAAPKNTLISTIPIYNIGGALNRNSNSRTNQNGPVSYGFRGNARNYDLNRDFIKNDTKNAQSFAQIYHAIQPHVFVDNHVSNGADYQYTLTHLFTQHNKLGGELGNYQENSFMPKLEQSLAEKKWDITPYVNVFNSVPEKGFSQFMDYPRYSTGYTTLWNSIGLMVETHMLKPYKQRVEGTYELLKSLIEISDIEHQQIADLRTRAFEKQQQQNYYPLQWKIDTTQIKTLKFKGFEGEIIPSNVTGFPRLKYNKERPFTKEVAYQNTMIATDSVRIPAAYVLRKGQHAIIPFLERNNIVFNTLKTDTMLQVERYKINTYNTRNNAYEGHYLHYNTTVAPTVATIPFTAGDFIIPTNQEGMRYLMETLEPGATDSFFNWNFFDTILQQKEGFSPYVFEEIAEELLLNNPEIKTAFEAKKTADVAFAKNWYAQLDWLHKQSAHYESAHLQYPVYRILK